MTQAELQQQALSRARNSASWANYGAIFDGFAALGIPESDIKPRENVFTYHAWRALGRQVRRGEHGVKVCTWVPIQDRSTIDPATGETVVKPGGKRPKLAVVFHVSQTDPIGGAP